MNSAPNSNNPTVNKPGHDPNSTGQTATAQSPLADTYTTIPNADKQQKIESSQPSVISNQQSPPGNQQPAAGSRQVSTYNLSSVAPSQVASSPPVSSVPNGNPPPASPAVTVAPQFHSGRKLPLILIIILLVITILGFAGSFFFFNLQKSKKTAQAPQITPPISLTPSKAPTPTSYENPFISPTVAFENPFISPTVAFENPFGVFENPFADATKSGSSENEPYQNPFDNLE